MAADSGIRDGEFFKFSGWDLSGYDQAYLPALKGKIPDLKRTVLEKQGNAFLAFNSNGWIKSWSVLDFNKFTRSAGTDLYVRVEFPGWVFLPTADTPENDLERITNVSTVTALIETIVDKYQGNNVVAAFNTNGWVKSKVVYPLRYISSPTSLSGLYIRTRFLDYNFYSRLDSPGGDIKDTKNLKNDVPALIKTSSSIPNAGGFNTTGWHKHTLSGPPPTIQPAGFMDLFQGIYYRTCWPDFIHLPGLDSPSNDIRQVTGKQLHELIDAARKEPNAVAVNTNGWLKRDLVREPREVAGAENLKGIYVKLFNSTAMASSEAITTTNDHSLITTAIFALKGTVIIWARWVFKDANTRQEYAKAVSTATDDILKRISDGTTSAAAGAAEAHEMRNQFLIGMRDKTSPPGLLIARSIKPAGGSYQYYLDKNSRTRYGKDFANLTEAEAKQVAVDTISSAGRANPNVTAVMRKAGMVSKGVIVIAAAVSVYSIATAQDWEVELGHQVLSWSGAITAGELGAGVGALVGGPVGAILGGIAGSILGGLGAESLARWFFGGSSSAAAAEILGFALQESSKVVKKKMNDDGCQYHTHVIRVAHTVIYTSAGEESKVGTVQEMVNDVPNAAEMKNVKFGSDNEVLATVTWVQSGSGVIPGNAANPGDLIRLMDFVTRNLPSR